MLFDAITSSAFGGGTTLTFAHTTSGTNRLLRVYVYDGNANVTGVTYNGVAMTLINSFTMLGGAAGQIIRAFELIAPATGANNVVVTGSAAMSCYASAASYTSVNQTGQPDGSNTGGAASATSQTTSITTVADNCWLLGYAYSNNAVTAGTNTTLRGGSIAGLQVFDTNGAQTPPGVKSVQTTQTPADFIGHVVSSYSPIVVATSFPDLRAAFL